MADHSNSQCILCVKLIYCTSSSRYDNHQTTGMMFTCSDHQTVNFKTYHIYDREAFILLSQLVSELIRESVLCSFRTCYIDDI